MPTSTESLSSEKRILLAPEDAAQLMSVGRTYVYQMMAAGELRSLKMGRLRRIPLSEVERFVSARLGEAADAT